MVKALVLLSGGLDSLLAAKVLQEQGVEVTGLSFKSYFFNTDKAKKAAEQLGIKLIEADFSEEHLKMVKNPVHGYGKNFNPCIDCHGLMLKKAGEYLTPSLTSPAHTSRERGNLIPLYKSGEYDFIATGEVLGQRPMSQNKDSLRKVEKISGLTGRLVRPLSVKLLDETIPEKEGKLIRGQLLDISGRSRQRQLELVKKYKIKEYPNAAGGCLLTDPAFSKRLSTLIKNWPGGNGNDIELLKYGRIFWLEDKVLVIIGRNERENKKLVKLAIKNDIIIELAAETGPTTLLRSKNYPATAGPHQGGGELKIKDNILDCDVPDELAVSHLRLGEARKLDDILKLAMQLTGYYSTKARGNKKVFKIVYIR